MTTKQKAVLITMDAPYAQMLVNGEMDFIFKDELSKEVEELGTSMLAYIYETSVNGGIGKIVGTVTITGIYYPFYKHQTPCNSGLVEERYRVVKVLYYNWCAKKNVKPNPNEGWFKSKKFAQYRDDIGFSDNLPNYVLTVEQQIGYPNPMELSILKHPNGELVKRPFRTMFAVYD